MPVSVPEPVCEKMTSPDIMSEGVFLLYLLNPKQCAVSVIVIKGMTAARFQEAGEVIVHVGRGRMRQQVAETRQENSVSFHKGF